ncbi:orotidine-5'-phosphate decarboxylase [Parvibium lacunae]|uniref:Orotidine 5'-phosphate decarboxylase n=1 Tax=Parvibium lacunae TaxID=1888893 RepID=A0A368L1K4_9BURK|nr:orotidine-5'-phosphate decarboxylase [Parvibium lacunae]RCS57363.1 orotidine-5'-phosphate decarboxylase [Parvibium lacunae]
MNYTQALQTRWINHNTLLCVGLDPDPRKIPAHLQDYDDPLLHFLRSIIDSTADLVCAFKPQIAYFSAIHAEDKLETLIDYIHHNYPGIPVILDAKRGDIGATAEQYAREAFERYKADAVTVNPYMGGDTLEPYLAYSDKGVIVLCRTSNPGGDDFQMLPVPVNGQSQPLYQYVAHKAATAWNRNGNVSLVVGATYPAELAAVRQIIGDMPLLVPGIGAQGGDVQAAVQAGKTPLGSGLVINSSRAILYASQGADFADQARAVALATQTEINQYR